MVYRGEFAFENGYTVNEIFGGFDEKGTVMNYLGNPFNPIAYFFGIMCKNCQLGTSFILKSATEQSYIKIPS